MMCVCRAGHWDRDLVRYLLILDAFVDRDRALTSITNIQPQSSGDFDTEARPGLEKPPDLYLDPDKTLITKLYQEIF